MVQATIAMQVKYLYVHSLKILGRMTLKKISNRFEENTEASPTFEVPF